MESKESGEPPESVALTERLAGLFGVVGGLASLLVGIGYIYHFAFFRTVGATWLLRELTLGEITFGSALPLTLVAVYALFVQLIPAFARLLNRSLRPPHFAFPSLFNLRGGVIMTLLGLAIVIFTLNINMRFFSKSLQNQSLLLGTVLLALASAILALLALAAARSSSLGERQRSAMLILWFAIVGLVLTPAVSGIVSARARLDRPEDFSCAVVANAGVQRCLPIIYVGSERLYCLLQSDGSVPSQILPIQWSAVRAVRLARTR